MNAVDWPALNASADLAEAARDAAAEAARAEHKHRLATDREYLRRRYEDACDDRDALRDVLETILRVCDEARADEAQHPGAALGGLVAIAADVRRVLSEVR
jgi:hypothetical protein